MKKIYLVVAYTAAPALQNQPEQHLRQSAVAKYYKVASTTRTALPTEAVSTLPVFFHEPDVNAEK